MSVNSPSALSTGATADSKSASDQIGCQVEVIQRDLE